MCWCKEHRSAARHEPRVNFQKFGERRRYGIAHHVSLSAREREDLLEAATLPIAHKGKSRPLSLFPRPGELLNRVLVMRMLIPEDQRDFYVQVAPQIVAAGKIEHDADVERIGKTGCAERFQISLPYATAFRLCGDTVDQGDRVAKLCKLGCQIAECRLRAAQRAFVRCVNRVLPA